MNDFKEIELLANDFKNEFNPLDLTLQRLSSQIEAFEKNRAVFAEAKLRKARYKLNKEAKKIAFEICSIILQSDNRSGKIFPSLAAFQQTHLMKSFALLSSVQLIKNSYSPAYFDWLINNDILKINSETLKILHDSQLLTKETMDSLFELQSRLFQAKKDGEIFLDLEKDIDVSIGILAKKELLQGNNGAQDNLMAVLNSSDPKNMSIALWILKINHLLTEPCRLALQNHPAIFYLTHTLIAFHKNTQLSGSDGIKNLEMLFEHGKKYGESSYLKDISTCLFAFKEWRFLEGEQADQFREWLLRKEKPDDIAFGIRDLHQAGLLQDRNPETNPYLKFVLNYPSCAAAGKVLNHLKEKIASTDGELYFKKLLLWAKYKNNQKTYGFNNLFDIVIALNKLKDEKMLESDFNLPIWHVFLNFPKPVTLASCLVEYKRLALSNEWQAILDNIASKPDPLSWIEGLIKMRRSTLQNLSKNHQSLFHHREMFMDSGSDPATIAQSAI